MKVIDRPTTRKIMAGYLSGQGLNILEAGCGRKWAFDKGSNTITGIDVDADALKLRTDLDVTVCGDLRTAELPTASFDVIFCNFVLEHIDGAEQVLDNFARWLKPNGVILITVPDRNSVYGFFTRITPFRAHVLYKRYLVGEKNAGKPGYGPYPTFHDVVIGQRGMARYARDRSMSLRGTYWFDSRAPMMVSAFMRVFSAITFRALSPHMNLMYVLERNDPTARAEVRHG